MYILVSLGIFLKYRFWLSRSVWSLRVCISDKPPGDAILWVEIKSILISLVLLALRLNNTLPLITMLRELSHSWFDKQLGRWKLLEDSRKKALCVWKAGFLIGREARSTDTCWFASVLVWQRLPQNSLHFLHHTFFFYFAGFHKIPCHYHWSIPLLGPIHFVLLSW